MVGGVRRIVMMIMACKPAIGVVTVGILGIYVLYAAPIVTVWTQSQTFLDIVPPAARHIGMLVISVISFALMFLMVRVEWNWHTRPITDAINKNVAAAFAKSFGIWFLANILASGLSMMLQPYARADALELGGIVASCIVLYDVMSFSETLQEILKHMLFALLFLMTIVNLFVAVPVGTPFRELAIVSVAATGIDFFLSYVVRRRVNMNSLLADVADHDSALEPVGVYEASFFRS
jgi:hypothetical protein